MGYAIPGASLLTSTPEHCGVADVGQNRLEEVDVVEKGLNYGWNVMEGTRCFSPSSGCDKTGLELPIVEYSRSAGNCSVTGGISTVAAVCRHYWGPTCTGDFCSGKIWGLRYDGGLSHGAYAADRLQRVNYLLRQDLDLNLYILSRNDGIYRLVP